MVNDDSGYQAVAVVEAATSLPFTSGIKIGRPCPYAGQYVARYHWHLGHLRLCDYCDSELKYDQTHPQSGTVFDWSEVYLGDCDTVSDVVVPYHGVATRKDNRVERYLVAFRQPAVLRLPPWDSYHEDTVSLTWTGENLIYNPETVWTEVSGQ